jgi:hypothetical protein
LTFFDYPRGKFGLHELMDVTDAAVRILGRKTDIMTRDSVHKALGRVSRRMPCRSFDAETLGKTDRFIRRLTLPRISRGPRHAARTGVWLAFNISNELIGPTSCDRA